jgi:uncharacterized repeat protein (TIGR01451 family)
MRSLTLALVYLALTILVASISAGAAGAQPLEGGEEALETPPVKIQVLESNKERIVVDIEIAAYTVSRRSVDGTLYDVVSIPGWGMTEKAGYPELPTRRVMVGIPTDAEIKLRVIEGELRTEGAYRLPPVPEVVLAQETVAQMEPWSGFPVFEERSLEAADAYGRDAFHPGGVASLGGVGWIRSQRVAAIELYPIQYNSVSKNIRFHSRFRVELTLSYPRGREVVGGATPENANYERILAEYLLNYDSARAWRGQPAMPVEGLAEPGWSAGLDAYKITIKEDGLYQLTYDDLAAAGVPVGADTFDPRTIQIQSIGEEVAVRIVGEEDGRFDADDYVLFYGLGIKNKYTERNVYWLSYGQTLGRRMAERSAAATEPPSKPTMFTSTVWVEENLGYTSLWPGDEDSIERWFWHNLLGERGYPVSVDMEVDLGHVASQAGPGSLKMILKGHNTWPTVSPDHHAEFFVNGYYIGEHLWNGKDTIETVELDVAPSYLTTRVNTFRVDLPADAEPAAYYYVDHVLFDRFELSYGHAYRADSNQLLFDQAVPGSWAYEITDYTQPGIEVFDVSDPVSVTRIISPVVEWVAPNYQVRFSETVETTTTYLALAPERWLTPEDISRDSPSDLRNTENGADYIIITHADFQPAAQVLAGYRAGLGLRTMVVDVEDVYDEFGYGLSVPEAIRDFVRHAHEVWQKPAPSYVLLLGDGTYDPKNYIDASVASYITPYLANVDPWMGETATDNWFVAVAGEDDLPDLFLGRMPANTLAEASIMVEKTISYEQSVPDADWTGHFVFVAGEQPDPSFPPAGDFHDISEALTADYASVLHDVTRVYLGNAGAAPLSTCASGSECKQQLVDAINEGAWAVTYNGHGSVTQWDGQYVFDLAAIEQLTNPSRLPVMLPMTCLEGKFTNPYIEYPAVSESMVRAEGKGAVASWGPTGLGVANGHDELNRGFLDAVLLQGIREFGPATFAGKLRLDNAGYSLEQIHEYTVFGDPALRLHAPPTDLQIEKQAAAVEELGPGDVVTFTLRFSNAGPGIALEPVLTDLVPPVLINPSVVYSSLEVLSQRTGITFSWTITDLLPHEGGELVFRAEVAPGVESPVAFFNEAMIESTTPDLVLANNRAVVGVGTLKINLPLILKGW